MSDTQELTETAPIPADPPPSGTRSVRRRRGVPVALAVALALVGALVGSLVTVVWIGGVPVGGSAAPAASGPGSQQPRDTNDPLRPEGRATLDASRSGTEAAVRGGWPLLHRDEFDGAALDRTFWHPYSGETTGGVGRHVPANLSVSDGTLKLTSRGYTSAGMAWIPGQQYGRWEVRARAQPGTGYGAVILLWPDAEDWPQGGEINFMEIPNPQRNETHFVLHYGEDNSQVGTSTAGDFTQWHTYAVEWFPDHVAGFIDGQETFRTTGAEKIPPRPMHLALQQDIGPYGNDWIPALDETSPEQVQLEVDWVRIYGL